MIRDASLEFCKATNETTSLNLAEALKRTRQELVEGIVQRGESLERLTKRVQTIFDSAETWRARRIAATESSRAVHSAQEEAAKQSGVVAGWEWLLSDDACPLCHTVARRAKQVRLGQAFAVVGDHPVYSEIRFPPLHPSCQCTVIEVLKPEYGGPENPQWAETLQQLKPTEEDGASPPRKPAGADAFSQGAGSTNPPPLPPLIQQSVDWWRKRKIKAEPRGYQNIVQYSSVSHADTVVASYDPNDRTVYVNENHPYWSDPNYIQQAHFLGESSTDDPLHVAYHEGAHALHHRKIGDAGYRALDRNPLTGDELVAARFVSEYAKTGEPEFVAEVYAGLVAGRSYNQDVMKVYRKLGGPKPPRRRGNP
jgi:SPP1 gp7 family putative phage head morphogenesis protein